MRDKCMCVRACVLVLSARIVTAVWSAWRETVMGFAALWMKTAIAWVIMLCFGLLTELRNGSIHLG